jgi:hypothetical protein
MNKITEITYKGAPRRILVVVEWKRRDRRKILAYDLDKQAVRVFREDRVESRRELLADVDVNPVEVARAVALCVRGELPKGDSWAVSRELSGFVEPGARAVTNWSGGESSDHRGGRGRPRPVGPWIKRELIKIESDPHWEQSYALTARRKCLLEVLSRVEGTPLGEVDDQ